MTKKRLGDTDILPAMREGHVPETPDGSSLGVPTGPDTKYLDLRDDGAWHAVDHSNKRIVDGKGDGRRPSMVSDEEYARRHCRTFGHIWNRMNETCVSCNMTMKHYLEFECSEGGG